MIPNGKRKVIGTSLLLLTEKIYTSSASADFTLQINRLRVCCMHYSIAHSANEASPTLTGGKKYIIIWHKKPELLCKIMPMRFPPLFVSFLRQLFKSISNRGDRSVAFFGAATKHEARSLGGSNDAAGGSN